jgi:hypothetical protein
VGTDAGSAPAGDGSGGESIGGDQILYAGPSGLPCAIDGLLKLHCTAGCHGSSSTPLRLLTYADLIRPSRLANQTNAQLALERMRDASKPMPPSGLLPASEPAALESWIAAGYPHGTCGQPADGGTFDAGLDPFADSPRCTSGQYWDEEDEGSKSMYPGRACLHCHQQSREGPTHSLAGTLYPSGHEPNDCNGSSGSITGAQIVVTDASSRSYTLIPNRVGNFFSETNLVMPLRVKVTYRGRQRVMAGAITEGDCNSCHTQFGANGAPGRILLP